MTQTKTDTTVRISGSDYILEVSADKIAVYLAGEHICSLDPRSALNTAGDGDATNIDGESEILSFTETGFTPSRATFTWTSKSSNWESKTYTLTCLEDRFEYSVTVKGSGNVDSVNYFSGNITEPCHGSDYDFFEGYHPVVPLDGSPMTYGANQKCNPFSYLTVPPMFFHCFKTTDVEPQLMLGLVAEKGEHNFTKFDYLISEHRWGSKFWLATNQDGHTAVSGEWTAPKIVGCAVQDRDDAARTYCDLYFNSGICSRGDASQKPRFWHGPIACGWLEQLAVHYQKDTGLIWGCRQEMYEELVRKLGERDLHPTILIIDDKWQEQYGTATVSRDRWQDLRAFIDRNLEKGIRTMMWYKMWDSEGVPEEYCLWDENEKRYVVDPTNPGYQAILKENIHRIISSDEGCYNACGLKIDFAFWQPLGRKANSYSGKYGVELFYELVKLIRTYIKEEKPDAILNASPCHPIFAELVDQARLHDYDYKQRNALEEFGIRASLYKAALPNALIDTDGCGYNTRRDTMRYLTGCSKLGIPDMYAVSDTPYLSLSDDDWKAVAQSWHDYEKKIDLMY